MFGTSLVGGQYSGGFAFELVHPQVTGRPWHEKILWHFGGTGDSATPEGGLTRGPDGALYGTLYHSTYPQDFGAIYRLAPPQPGQTAWQEQVIASPDQGQGVIGSVQFDDQGAAYAVTVYGSNRFSNPSYGTVFKAIPPAAGQTGWAEQTVLTLTDSSGWFSAGGLTRVHGRLFGTGGTGGLHNFGTVYDFAPRNY